MRRRIGNAAVIFGIVFIIFSGVTIHIISTAVHDSRVKYNIAPNYFDVYSSPFKDTPDRIISHPDAFAYPQSLFDHPYYYMNISKGILSINGQDTASRSEFEARTKSSDDQYGVIIPTESSSESSLLANYYVFTDKFNHHIALPLSPNLDHYLAFDSLDGTSGTITDNSSLSEITSRFTVANNPYLFPDEDTYISIESDSDANNVSVDVSTGGVSVFNDSLYAFYSVLDSHRAEITAGKLDPETLLSYLFADTAEEYYESYLVYAVVQSQNSNFFKWFAEKCFSYDSFLEGLGIDISKGYKVFALFNPYSVTEIRGKIALYIDIPQSQSAPSITNYSVQCYNYAAEKWVTIMTRTRDPTLPMVNTWLYDEFIITNQPWQYIYDFQGDSDAAKNSIKWRVIVNAERDPDDTDPIKVRLAGLWTALEQTFKEFDLDFKFKVSDPDVIKQNIISCRFIIEYHTEGWDPLYDGVYVTDRIGSYSTEDNYYNIETGEWESESHTIDYNLILDNGQIYANPVRDNRIGVTIPMSMISDDTDVIVHLNGRFSAYNRYGEELSPKIYIDKISVQYEYKTPIPIVRKTWVFYDSLDLFYWTYDINITSNVVYLEFPYPSDWIFIDKYFALVEKLDTGENVSSMWIDSKKDPAVEDLYDGDSVRFNSYAMFYLGAGEYRFWFRSFNYATDFSAYNSTLGKYSTGQMIKMEDKTYYNLTLTGTWLNPEIKRNYEGALEITFTGYSADGKSQKTIGPFYGKQYNYSDGISVFWNAWYLNYTHFYEDGIYGYVRVDAYWHSIDYSEIGYKILWLYIAYTSDKKPIVSLIEPSDGGKWGFNKTNYVILASWHMNTQRAWAIVDGTPMNLTRLTDYIDNNGTVPRSMIDIPSELKSFFWIAPVNTSEIVGMGDEDSVEIEVTVGSIASYGSNILESDNVTVKVSVVSEPDFKLEPVQNVPLGQKAKITYYCPEGIKKMEVYVMNKLQSIKVAEIESSEYKQSSYLYQGYHVFYIPFTFSAAGVYQVKVVVYDDVGNSKSVISNEFSAVDPDDRVWILRVLDNAVEISILWFSYLFGGYVFMKKNRRRIP